MQRTVARLIIVAGVVTSLFLTVGGGVALAHWVYQQGYVWQADSGRYCLKDKSSVWTWADGTDEDKTTSSSGSRQDIGVPYTICETGTWNWNRPPYYLAVTNILDTSAAQSIQCMTMPFSYNTVSAAGWDQNKTWNHDNVHSCMATEAGYMGNWGGAFVLVNGVWQGGYVWSGWHWWVYAY